MKLNTIATTTLCLVAFATAAYWVGSNYPATSPSGRSVYIAEDMCAISMTEDRDVNEINKDFIWCMEQHLNHLADKE